MAADDFLPPESPLERAIAQYGFKAPEVSPTTPNTLVERLMQESTTTDLGREYQEPTAAPEALRPLNLREMAGQKWQEIRSAVREATAEGLGKYLSGPGRPERVFGVFRPFMGPGPKYSYGPSQYRGIWPMGRRLRLIENEASAPMVSLRQAALQNPLVRQARIRVAALSGATGRVGYPGGRPEVVLAPVVNPNIDPGVTVVHEVVGHLGHGPMGYGPVGWQARNRQEFEQVVRPPAEGLATGVERGIYGKLWPGSAYEYRYRDNPLYQQAKALGESLAQHIAKTGHVPHPWLVGRRVFGPPPASPESRETTTPAAKGTPGGTLRALGIRNRKKEDTHSWDIWWKNHGSRDLTKKTFGIAP